MSVSTGALTTTAALDGIKQDIAADAGCDAFELSCEEIEWADGERVAEFILLDNRILGSLDDRLTEREWQQVLAIHAGEIEPPMSFEINLQAAE